MVKSFRLPTTSLRTNDECQAPDSLAGAVSFLYDSLFACYTQAVDQLFQLLGAVQVDVSDAGTHCGTAAAPARSRIVVCSGKTAPEIGAGLALMA